MKMVWNDRGRRHGANAIRMEDSADDAGDEMLNSRLCTLPANQLASERDSMTKCHQLLSDIIQYVQWSALLVPTVVMEQRQARARGRGRR